MKVIVTLIGGCYWPLRGLCMVETCILYNLTVHGTVPPLETSSCQYASKTSLQSMPHAQPQKHWALFKSCLLSSKAHLHKLALITLCCSAPSLPGTLLGYLHHLFEKAGPAVVYLIYKSSKTGNKSGFVLNFAC